MPFEHDLKSERIDFLLESVSVLHHVKQTILAGRTVYG